MTPKIADFFSDLAFKLKSVNRWLLPFLILIICLFVIFNQTIFAQIEDLYSKENKEIAGISPLMEAVTNNDIDGVRFFSKSSAAVINQKNFGGATALHLAARQGSLEMARILVENGADVNAIDLEGWTPLMRAAFFQNNEIVDLLLSNGAAAQLLNSIGESAIVHATISDCDKCLDLLFTKFNFIKYMGISTLKEQLSEAFIIARNHENKITQNAIEGYLDKIIKLSPLIMTRNVAPQNQYYLKNQNDFETIPTPTKTIYAPATQKIATPQTNNISEPIAPTQTRQISQNPTINKNEPQNVRKFKFIFKGQALPSSTQTQKSTMIIKQNDYYQTTNYTPSSIATTKPITLIPDKSSKIIETSHYSQNLTNYNSNNTNFNQNKTPQPPTNLIKKFKFKKGPTYYAKPNSN
jgi:hypothetical protein